MGWLEKLRRSWAPWDDRYYGVVSAGSSAHLDADPEAALSVSPWYVGIAIIAAAMGVMPLHLYRRRERSREPVKDHPWGRLVSRRPNAWQTPFEWREMSQGHIFVQGNTYARKLEDRTGRPIGLVPLHPARVEVRARDGGVVYLFRRPGAAEPTVYSSDEILHIPGFGTNGLVGMSVVGLARKAIALTSKLEDTALNLFDQDARPGGYLKHPGRLGAKARHNILDSWKADHLGNPYEPALLEEGMEWVSVGFKPDEAQFIQSRSNQVVEAARYLNIPPHKLKELSRATFSNIEQQSIEFVVDTVTPWAVRWEQRLNLSLLTEEELDAGLYFKFSVEGLLRGDSAARAAFYGALFNVGVLSPNDIRALEELDPAPGGDQRFVPMNMVPLEQAAELAAAAAAPPPAPAPAEEGEEEEEEPEEGEEEAARALAARSAPAFLPPAIAGRSMASRRRLRIAFEPLLADAARRLLRHEVEALRRALRKTSGGRDIVAFLKWVDDFYSRELAELAQKRVGPTFAGLAEAIAGEAALEAHLASTPDLTRYARGWAGVFGEQHVRRSSARIRRTVRDAGPEDVEEALGELAGTWERERPGKIARAESRRAANAFAVQTWALGGSAGLIWVTSGRSSCPRCDAMDGRRVGIEEPFLPAGASLKVGGEDGGEFRPRSSVRYPPLHSGCDCDVVPG